MENKAWVLMLGLILWNIWKGRNIVVLKNWEPLTQSICKKNSADPIAFKFFCTPNLSQGMVPSPPIPRKKFHVKSPSIFHPPPDGFVKISFDGASKGNPRPTRYGGILRDSIGNLLGIFARYYGSMTNNLEELTGLEKELILAGRMDFYKIQISRYSSLAIKIAQKFIDGSPPSKIVRSWHLEA